jgi:hypothetical protein
VFTSPPPDLLFGPPVCLKQVGVMCWGYNNGRVNVTELTLRGVPKQARCGPEGSRRFRLPDFMTFGT